MSRTGSTSASGVRVAAQPLSNIYTVLLLVAVVALGITVVMACVTLQSRYGSILPIGGGANRAQDALADARSRQQGNKAELDEVQAALERFPQESPDTSPPAAGRPATAPAGG